jgi:hypothetical protein
MDCESFTFEPKVVASHLIMRRSNLSRGITRATENVFPHEKLLSRQNSIFPAFSQKRVRKYKTFQTSSLLRERSQEEGGKKSLDCVHYSHAVQPRNEARRKEKETEAQSGLRSQRLEGKGSKNGTTVWQLEPWQRASIGESGGGGEERKRILNYEYKSAPRQLRALCCVVAGSLSPKTAKQQQ